MAENVRPGFRCFAGGTVHCNGVCMRFGIYLDTRSTAPERNIVVAVIAAAAIAGGDVGMLLPVSCVPLINE